MRAQHGGEDFRDADLGDVRRNKRLMAIMEAMALQPNATLPTIAGSEAELEGLYRFVGNPAVDAAQLLKAHQVAVAERAVGCGTAIVIHDTTSFQFAHADPNEVGFLQTGKPGFYAHFSFVVSADGQRRPLGIAALTTMFRSQRRRRSSRNEAGSVTTKRSDRESIRWEDGIEQSEQLLVGCAERIHVADREADSFQLLAKLQQHGCRFVFRVRHDRAARQADDADGDWSKLKELVGTANCCLEREVPLSARRNTTAPRQARAYPQRKARRARLRFAATRLVLRRPRYFGDEMPEAIALNVVRVHEVDAPAGQEPVEWTLFTSEAADSPEAVARVVDIYRTRWLIEEFFKALKTGCIYEQRQLESRHALLNMLAMSLPLACQLLWIRSRAHHAPDAPATDVLTARQIRVLGALRRKPLPNEPKVKHVMAAIAELGGHWRSNGAPGWLTLRRGLERVLDTELGWVLCEKARKNAINR